MAQFGDVAHSLDVLVSHACHHRRETRTAEPAWQGLTDFVLMARFLSRMRPGGGHP